MRSPYSVCDSVISNQCGVSSLNSHSSVKEESIFPREKAPRRGSANSADGRGGEARSAASSGPWIRGTEWGGRIISHTGPRESRRKNLATHKGDTQAEKWGCRWRLTFLRMHPSRCDALHVCDAFSGRQTAGHDATRRLICPVEHVSASSHSLSLSLRPTFYFCRFPLVFIFFTASWQIYSDMINTIVFTLKKKKKD